MFTETVKVGFVSRRRTTRERGRHSLVHRVIVGVKVGDRPALNLSEDQRWGEDPRMEFWRLPRDFALRLETFVQLHYMERRKDYNCFTFSRFIAGLYPKTDGINDDVDYVYDGAPIEASVVEPCTLYHMRQSGLLEGDHKHGVIGFTRGVCLSVLGDNQPLTWAPTSELMKLYRTDVLSRVLRVEYDKADTHGQW